jgi:hypothetical protein
MLQRRLMKYRGYQHTNSSPSLILYGAVFAIAALAAGAIFGQRSTLNCRRLESKEPR